VNRRAGIAELEWQSWNGRAGMAEQEWQSRENQSRATPIPHPAFTTIIHDTAQDRRINLLK